MVEEALLEEVAAAASVVESGPMAAEIGEGSKIKGQDSKLTSILPT